VGPFFFFFKKKKKKKGAFVFPGPKELQLLSTCCVFCETRGGVGVYTLSKNWALISIYSRVSFNQLIGLLSGSAKCHPNAGLFNIQFLGNIRIEFAEYILGF